MVTLVLLLYLSPIFGGTISAVVTLESMESCHRLARVLQKFSVKHDVVQPCRIVDAKK